jgi:hypothetical protein
MIVEVLKAPSKKMAVFWHVCTVLPDKSLKTFRGAYLLKQAASISETSVNFYQTIAIFTLAALRTSNLVVMQICIPQKAGNLTN